MNEQPALFDATVLTPRQQLALEQIGAMGGLTADEVGAWAHTIAGPRSTFTHASDVRCKWCAKAGKQIADKLIELGLAKRRRGAERGLGYVYVLANDSGTQARALDGPDDEIPF